MKAFVGHSFNIKDEDLVNKIMNFLSNKVGIHCEDAEKAENRDISDKIKEKIDRNEIFVGIFTIEREIKQLICTQEISSKSFIKKLKTCIKPEVPKESISPLVFTTSNWVIQESGYAIGKGKEIILLVERGVDKFPELQGDKEIIFFDRMSLDAPLLKLYEIVNSIKSKTEKVGATISPEIPNKEERANDGGEQEKPKGLPWSEMFAAHRKGDIAQVEDIYKNKIKNYLKPETRVLWDAILCKWRYCSGNADALAELIKMSEETKNYIVNRTLANCYDFAENNELARQQFAKCMELTEHVSEKVDCIIDISMSYAEEKNYDLAIDKLLDAINNSGFNSQLEKIFLKLVEIAKMEEDDYLYIMFAEKALNINAVNLTLRFNLGLKYLNMSKNDLAVYHYKKYLNIQENSGGFNNIAIAYANLNMKAKEADCLEKAIQKKDDTLPYANVAQKYLDEGFTNDADRLLKEAEELGGQKIEVNEGVGIAKGRLKTILEDEDKKEKEIIETVIKIHKFKIRHVDAHCFKNSSVNTSELSGIWITEKWGELDFKFNIAKKSFEVYSKKRIENSLGFANLVALGAFGAQSQPLPRQYKTRKVEIKGNFNNLSGKYTIKVTEEKEGTFILGARQSLLDTPSPEEIYSANGLLIIENAANINILEEDSKNNRLFSHWNKK